MAHYYCDVSKDGQQQLPPESWDALLTRVREMRRSKSGDRIGPHKNTVLAWAFSELLRTGQREWPIEIVLNGVDAVLQELGLPPASALDPVWRLQRDGLCQINRDGASLQTLYPTSAPPSRQQLITPNTLWSLPSAVADLVEPNGSDSDELQGALGEGLHESEARVLVSLLNDAAPTGRLISVYVPQTALANLEVGLAGNIWGWSTKTDEFDDYQAGDLILLAVGGGGRVDLETLMSKHADRLIIGQITSSPFVDDEPVWPDERTSDRSYPYRVNVRWRGEIRSTPYRALPSSAVKEIQRSGTKQGRGFITELTNSERTQLLMLFQEGGLVTDNPLQEAMQRVLELQDDFSADVKTPAMVERGVLVKSTISDMLANEVEPLSVEGRFGAGNAAKVPWVRVYEPTSSPSAQHGLYLVYLFAADGSAVYLSLIQGTTEGSELKHVPKATLATRADHARSALSHQIDDLELTINLASTGLPAQYESGHIAGWKYERGAIPDDNTLRSDLTRGIQLLMALLDPTSVNGPLETLATTLYLDSPDHVRTIIELLDDRPQAIFYGPPGTGKTFIAQALAEHLTASGGDWELVQFHPSYSYEDFVEGWRPREDGGFFLKPGVLKRFAERAQADPDGTYVLIIDEINRANLSKVFGELFFLLEYRDKQITLQYSDEGDEPFGLPANLKVIGTMNTADRSIALVDAALRRRFYFHPFFPTEAPIAGTLRRYLAEQHPSMSWVADMVERVNDQLGDRNLAIGHSHFMKRDLTENQVERIWAFSILPYIEDNFFDSHEGAQAYAFDKVRRP